MANEAVRVGLIGAGLNTRDRHIPGFRKVDGVEIVAVANRTRESGQRVADQFNIPQVYDDWRELLEDDNINAVCIGTWPYMHRTLTLASLEKDKHVLCEARMASNAREAHDMLNAAKAKPHLTTQIVPSPLTFKVDNLLRQLIADGYLGDLLAVEIQALGTDFIDFDSPLHWRHDRDLSGYNILAMGIWYEAMIRWVGRAAKVMAMTQVYVPHRRDQGGKRVGVTIPDHVDIICLLANGAQAHLRHSSVTGLSPGNEVWLYGTDGTLRLDQQFNVYGGRRGDQQLAELANPPEKQYAWRVEEEFIGAIHGQEPVTHTPFDVGVHYMEWTEAVTRSAQTGQAVSLPL
jgi:predicted dehydrogenase